MNLHPRFRQVKIWVDFERTAPYRGRHNAGDEVANFLSLFFMAVGDKSPDEDLRGEQRGPHGAHFGIGDGPLAAVEVLHCELDQDLVRGMR